MKKYLLIILLFVSASAIGQQMKFYAIKCNTNGSIDSIYLKLFTDSLFLDGNFVQLSKEHFQGQFSPAYPNGFENYVQRADDIWINTNCLVNNATIIPIVVQDGLDLKANTTHSHLISELSNASTVGTNLLGISNPASPSLIRVNANGTTVTRTVAEAQNDLGVDLKQDIATNTGGWMVFTVTGANATTTGQVLVDITGLVSGTLANATKYEVEAILDVGTSAVTTGCQYAIQTGGTGSAGVVSSLIIGTTTTNAAAISTLSAPNTAQGTFLTTSNGSGTITMRGWVTTRGTGTATISIQHLKITSGTSTVRTGSKMRIRLAQ